MQNVLHVRLIELADGRCEISADPGTGAVQVAARAPVVQFDDALRKLEESLSRAARTRRTQLDNYGEPQALTRDGPETAAVTKEEEVIAHKPDVAATVDFGTILFEFLFQGKIGDAYNRAKESAYAKNEPLRIRLYVEHDQMTRMPWETLYDQETRSFISLSRQTLLTRRVRSDDLRLTRPRNFPLRILGMVARPAGDRSSDLHQVGAEDEMLGMRAAMDTLLSDKKVEIVWTLSGRQRDLERAIDAPVPPVPWSVFHFIGHGGFSEKERKGYLIVEEENGADADVLFSDVLGQILIGPNSPSLVVLNSCQGAYAGSVSSTAADLALGGIPAVVGMQFAVTEGFAQAFSRHFYTYLSNGLSVELALTRTRSRLKQDKYFEWPAPVLYLRTTDSTLFGAT